MKVVLKNDCFIDGVRYRAVNGNYRVRYVEMPEELRDRLPSSAVVLEDPKPVTVEEVQSEVRKTLKLTPKA